MCYRKCHIQKWIFKTNYILYVLTAQHCLQQSFCVRERVRECECVLMHAGISGDATVTGSERWQQGSRLVDLAHEEDGTWGHRWEASHESLACFCKPGQILSSVLASIWIYSCFGSTASSDEKLNSVNVFKILPQNSVIRTCWVVSDEEEERSVHCHPGWRGTSQQDGS